MLLKCINKIETNGISIKIILDKLLRHPLLRDLTLETVVDLTIDFMRIVGAPKMFIEKTEILNIVNYRAALPCDFYKMIQVRTDKNQVFRYSTDSFHFSECKDLNRSITDFTYKIQGNIIYTSLDEGKIEIVYEAIETDSDGYPIIPDNSSFTRALESYIKKYWFTILFDEGKIAFKSLENAQQEYAWNVGDCQTEFNRLTLDEAESLYNSWKTLIVRDTEHSNGFKNNGTKERIKIH